MEENMKLEDLKTGMIVTTADGIEYVVFRDVESYTTRQNHKKDIILNKAINNWDLLSFYNEDLTCSYNESHNIIKVELPNHPYSLMDLNYEKDERRLLWERKEEIKAMTMADLEKYFGCKVKIIK